MPSRAPLGERDGRVRAASAVAGALAIHAVLFAVLRDPVPPAAARTTPSQTIAIVMRTPAPTPRPTPNPTPPPVVTPPPKATPTPVVAVRAPAPRAAAPVRKHVGGAAAPKHVVVHKAKAAVAVSVAPGIAHGVAPGGTGTGAGPGAGDGGLAGTASGVAGTGTGNGALANTAPCGDVDLIPRETTYMRDGTVHQTVEVEIRLKDGTVEDGTFPYPFVFAGEAANPFEHTSALVDGGVPVQMPPPGTDVANASLAVRTVIEHTDRTTGKAKLPSCGSGVAQSGDDR